MGELRRVWLIAVVCVLAACGSGTTDREASPPPPGAPADEEADEAVGREAAEPEIRCLPVVAADCGCVYSCGLGTRDSEGWSVLHEHWGDTPVRARVASWCVDEECTDAFHGEIVCSGICPPRPADPSCVLDADGCRSTADAPP